LIAEGIKVLDGSAYERDGWLCWDEGVCGRFVPRNAYQKNCRVDFGLAQAAGNIMPSVDLQFAFGISYGF
jgi:hypothetical protein